jgi:hypothetical protein
VFVVCCVVSFLCDELIMRSEESYRVCVGRETSAIRRLRPQWAVAPQKKELFSWFISILSAGAAEKCSVWDFEGLPQKVPEAHPACVEWVAGFSRG